MNKTCLIVRLAAVVLSAGLVSCAKDDTKTRDVFRAPPPVINSKGKHELRDWDKRSDKVLDLQDSLDLSPAKPVKVEITTRCRRDQISFVGNFSFVSREAVKIFQILPDDVLTRDLTKEKVECALELVLINAAGSRHIYHINSTPIADVTGAGVILEKTGTDEKVSRIHSRQLEGLRLRYRNSSPSSAQVICQDITFGDLPFEHVMELNNFDFSRPEKIPGSPADALIENTLQPCRILIRSAGQVQQVGPRFLLRMPHHPMTAAVAQILIPSAQEKTLFFTGLPLNIGIVDIKNVNRGSPRFYILRKALTESTVHIFGPMINGAPNDSRNIVINAFILPWLHASPVATPGVTVEDKGDSWRIVVPGGASARLILKVVPPRARVCPGWSYIVQSEDLAVAGKFALTEVSDVGEVLEEKMIYYPRISFPSPHNFEAKLTKPIAGAPCAW